MDSLRHDLRYARCHPWACPVSMHLVPRISQLDLVPRDVHVRAWLACRSAAREAQAGEGYSPRDKRSEGAFRPLRNWHHSSFVRVGKVPVNHAITVIKMALYTRLPPGVSQGSHTKGFLLSLCRAVALRRSFITNGSGRGKPAWTAVVACTWADGFPGIPAPVTHMLQDSAVCAPKHAALPVDRLGACGCWSKIERPAPAVRHLVE